METLKRIKPYKAKDPYETINIIRNILERCDIFTTEVPCKNYNENIFSSYIFINDNLFSPDVVKIGTNGKGMTPRYSLASAYGEFIERLQNNYLINLPYIPVRGESCVSDSLFLKRVKDNDLLLDFFHAPDEKLYFPEEIPEYVFTIFKEHYNNDKQLLLDYLKIAVENNGKTLCMPYYCYNTGTIKYLPWRNLVSMCASNGMCSGNTKEEALIQGICEIFERYAIKQIFFDNISPPDVPLEYFKGTDIYDKVKYIEKTKNIYCRIKDCSLGIGLPVIGLLFIDRNCGKYIFKLGSDPSPITSLERCLSEIYQRGYEHKLQPLNYGFDPFRTKDNIPGINLRYTNYYKILIKGIGMWPNNIFSENFSYPFNGLNNSPTISDRDDLMELMNLIRSLGRDIYIRETSYLDFPAFHIYIPGMSEHCERLKENIDLLKAYKKSKPVINNLENAEFLQLKELSDACDRLYKKSYPCFPFSNFKYISPNKFQMPPVEYFLTIIFYRLGNYNKAWDYINHHINRNKAASLEMKCFRDLIKMKMENYSGEKVKEVLPLFYGDVLAGKIISRHNQQEVIKQNVILPTCFNCSKCNFVDDCSYFDMLKLIKIQQKMQCQNRINQTDLKNIFSNIN